MGDNDVEILRRTMADGFARLEARLDSVGSKLDAHSGSLAAWDERCRGHVEAQRERDRRLCELERCSERVEVSQAAIVTRAKATWQTVTVIAAAAAGLVSLLWSLFKGR